MKALGVVGVLETPDWARALPAARSASAAQLIHHCRREVIGRPPLERDFCSPPTSGFVGPQT